MKAHHIECLTYKIIKIRLSKTGYMVTPKMAFNVYRYALIAALQNDSWCIELVLPTAEIPVVQGLTKKYRNVHYRARYVSNDLEKKAGSLKGAGFLRVVQLKPAQALVSWKACFFMNSQLGIIELLEEKFQNAQRYVCLAGLSIRCVLALSVFIVSG